MKECLMSEQTFWISVGLLGQALFQRAFLIQWAASERVRRSVIPIAFWWLSLLGGAAGWPMRFGAAIRCSPLGRVLD